MEAGTGYWCQRREAALHAHLHPRPERGHLGTGVAEAGGAGETLSLRKVNLSSMRTSEAPLRNAGKRGDRGNRGQGHDGEVTVRGYGVGANRPAVGQEERQGGRGGRENSPEEAEDDAETPVCVECLGKTRDRCSLSS